MSDYENLGIDLQLDELGDLQVGSTGDLAVTSSGRTTLLQDVANLLDTLPGDLFGHPEYGAGITRLVGEEDRNDFEQLAVRAIADALTYDPSVAPRIEPDSIAITPTRDGRQIQFDLSFVPLGEEWTNRFNMVWGLNTEL